MRAPPEAVTETSGTPCSAALSQARANFSPTTLPIEPPMKLEVHHRELARRSSIAARPMTIASPSPVESSASASRSLYGRRSKNSSGSSERRSAASSTKLSSSVELDDPFARVHREVVAALRADVERRRELVVAVVRAAASGTCSGAACHRP